MKIFWNAGEKRLRAFWRILLHFICFFALTLLFSGIAGAIAGWIVLAQQGDVSNIDQAKIVEMVSSNPLTALIQPVAMLGAMLLTYWIFTRVDRRPFRAFGFAFNGNWWKDFGFGLFLGAFLMLVIFVVELALGWVRVETTLFNPLSGPFGLAILGPVVTFFCVGIYEEMLSRGYQLLNAAEGLQGKWLTPHKAVLLSWVLTSSVFGALHAANSNATLVSTFMLVVAGLFLGLGYILTRQLAIPIGLHITWNFFQGNVFGFPVSGNNAGPTFIKVAQHGPDAFTGGAFGPEAGLICLMAILLGCLLIAGYLASQKRLHLREDIAIYRPEGRFIAAEEAAVNLPQ